MTYILPPASKGMGGHERAFRGETNDWLTPPYILDALGPFDLDPCASLDQPWATAAQHYTIEDDGLSQDWGDSLVYLNPPYGDQIWPWMEKLADHGNGIALIFARTETIGFFAQVWEEADALLFLKGRLKFCRPDGVQALRNSGAPSVLVAYGREAVRRLRDCKLPGSYVSGWDVV